MTKRKVLKRDSDVEFRFVTRQYGKAMEDWRSLASEWFAIQLRGRDTRMIAMNYFMIRYILHFDLTKNPFTFMRRDYDKPDVMSGDFEGDPQYTIAINNILHGFLDWILKEKCSVEDDHGHKLVISDYHNPLKRRSRAGVAIRSETNKATLPFRYIQELRDILAPGRNFQDWTFAHEAVAPDAKGKRFGDWIQDVDPKIIDRNDPDCVWRTRQKPFYQYDETSGRPRSKWGKVKGYTEVVDLWSPVRSVLVLIKLLLPLRTFQTRMLDSGEADTLRYVKGEWTLNKSPLAMGTAKRPVQKGVFHREIDARDNSYCTGFYINTNKTADINNEEDGGYIIPWQNEEALYWLEKLRDWQEKYNPISTPVPWTNLLEKHFGRVRPHEDILRRRGTSCFLFRDAASEDPNLRNLPVTGGHIYRLWYQLLLELENRTWNRGETLNDGSRIEFVDPESSTSTHYSPHSLRVSLITALAIDGGVPIPVLSKLIAGHARLIMTIYYTKVGKAQVSDVMEEAERRILESDKENYRRFLSEATYQQASEQFAMNDPSAALAASQQATPASYVFEDKGICPMSGNGCDQGGELIKKAGKSQSPKYGPVPGFPHKNCVRCRFFLTGPAFLPGLVAHFNDISYRLTEASNRYVSLEEKLRRLEDRRAECDENAELFTEHQELERFNRLAQQEAEKADELAHNLHAALRLVERSTELLRQQQNQENPDDIGTELVAAGGMSDISYALKETDSELHQLEVIAENSVIYPETDGEKASFRRSQIIDTMLELNGRKPVFFKLTSDQQLEVGNHLMRLLRQRTGSMEGAVAIAEGKILLSECGLLEDTVNLIESETGIVNGQLK